MKNTKVGLVVAEVIFILIIIIAGVIELVDNSGLLDDKKNNITNPFTKNTFNIIASQENKDLEEVIQNYARTKKYDINIEYAGTLDIMDKLNSGEKYDAVWISNSIWLYMLDQIQNIQV